MRLGWGLAELAKMPPGPDLWDVSPPEDGMSLTGHRSNTGLSAPDRMKLKCQLVVWVPFWK